jgi:hypothetical protein
VTTRERERARVKNNVLAEFSCTFLAGKAYAQKKEVPHHLLFDGVPRAHIQQQHNITSFTQFLFKFEAPLF